MARFRFRARNPRGEAVEGVINATSREAVADQLFASDLTPVEIVPAASGISPWEPLVRRLGLGRVKLVELIMFNRQMYTLLRAGVPIIRAINGLADSSRQPRLIRTLEQVVEDLEAGHPLADCLAAHPQVFTSLYVNIVRVGEESGRLDRGFLQLAYYLDREKETRERIREAFRYPSFVLATIAVATAVINLLVIPAFASVFSRVGADLPWATRLLVAVSDFTVTFWASILAAATAAAVAGGLWLRTPRGAYFWDRYKMRLPLIGGLIRQATLGRFARAFALAIEAGVPLIQGLGVVALAVDNRYVGSRLQDMRTGIQRGETLTRAAASTGLFSPLVLQMLAVGEETGAVGELLDQVGEFYEREVDYDLKRLSASIEPILITLIGLMVLVLGLGVFLPLWDLPGMALGRL